MPIRLFIDEDVGGLLAKLLRESGGFDVLTTVEAGRASNGFSDDQQLEFASINRRTLFSHNIKHYEPLAIRWAEEGRHHAGIVLATQLPAQRLLPGFLELQRLYPNGLSPDLCMRLPRV